MNLLDAVTSLGRVAAALERIARALEAGEHRALTGYVEEASSPDGSFVGTHDPVEAEKDLREREAYTATTGIELAPWEAVPKPLNPHRKEWSTPTASADWD